MNKKEISNLLIRYIILLLVAFPNLYIIYKIFTPLTVYPVLLILNLFYQATLESTNTIILKGGIIELVAPCIAGAAYYLLLILNLTAPMRLKKRMWSLAFLLSSFLVLNIARIILFSILFLNGYQYLDLAHSLTWYFGSTILVVLIWFSNVKIFKIKTIPVYTDFKNILKTIRREK